MFSNYRQNDASKEILVVALNKVEEMRLSRLKQTSIKSRANATTISKMKSLLIIVAKLTILYFPGILVTSLGIVKPFSIKRLAVLCSFFDFEQTR